MKGAFVKTLTRIAIAVAGVMFGGVMIGDRIARSQTEAPSFEEIARVLQSPRCMNCHPAGDAPLQTDLSRPHKQNIKRSFSELGGSCASCHQDSALPGANVPPGAPHWNMPPAATPMVFEGKTVAQLCVDLKDPEQNGHRSLEDLVHHVGHDPLVLWAFNPGGTRTAPPMSHEAFVQLISDWVAVGAPCPN
jgi:hypothetical protein